MIAPDKNRLANAKKAKSRRARRLCLWTIVAVLGAGCLGAAIWVFSQKETLQGNDNHCGVSWIRDVGKVGGGPSGTQDVTNNQGRTDEGENTPKNVDNDGGSSTKDAMVDPQRVGRLVKPPVRKKLFKHVSDSQIGRVLAIKPGGLVIGELNYHRNHFVENFKKSLEDPEAVVFNVNDTPEETELKKAVIEARAVLKDALERGEDIAEIMQEAEDELHEMQQYRMAMREQLIRYQKEEGVTVDDLEDFNAAVNQMLSEKGLEPIKSSRLRSIKAKLNRENNY